MPSCFRFVLGTVLFTVPFSFSSVAADDVSAAPASDRVVLAPLNLGVNLTPELEPGAEPVWTALIDHLASNQSNPGFLQEAGARDLWRSVMATLEEDDGVYDAYGRFAQRVAKQIDYDVLWMPALITRAADVRGAVARWDGARERARGVQDLARLRLVSGLQSATGEVSGQLAAASLHLVAISPNGDVLHETRSGLTLLQSVEKGPRGQIRTALRTDAFEDAKRLSERVRAATVQAVPAAPAP